jgi:penicillin-binding protein 1A
MDFRISPDDRVGGGGPKKGSKSDKPARGGKSAGRTEPQMGSGSFIQLDEEPRRKQQRGKSKVAGGKRQRKRMTLGRSIGRLFYLAVILGVWVAIAVIGVFVYYGAQLPSSNTWAIPARPANIKILAADGQLISNRGKSGGEAISLHELPYYVPEAVIAIEDRRFMSHWGIDPIGVAAALMDNVRARGVARGGSTITQQLAKNLFLTRDQTLGRKVQEALLALWLEHNYTKDEILELYLNRVFFGNNATGIEAAAQTYFGKSARNLSLGEAALLAGSLQAPSRLNPKSDPAAAGARQRVVLQSMADEGYITQAEAKAAAIDPNQPIPVKVAGSESYVADWVESLMQSYLGDVKQDVIVSTTINWDLEKQAEFLVKEMVAKEGKSKGFSQGALVAMETDGSVRAMVGGVDYTKSQFNRAITARRQPGSAFKPFVYLTAVENGYTPDSVVDDAPLNYNGWQPTNSENKYFGPVRLRDALAYSLNTVAARLAIAVTPQAVVDTAMRMGISSPIEAVPSVALGTSTVSLLELTAGYVPFANGGNGVIANVITRIATPDGKVLYEASPSGPGQVMTPESVGMMNDMMSNALQIGTGKQARLDGWPIAGKTGTSQKSRDALFVGYTSHMVTGVWLGNDDDSPTKLFGGTLPVAIWSDFMAKAHKGLPITPLPGNYNQTNDPNLQPMEVPPQQVPADQQAQQPGEELRPAPKKKGQTIVDIITGIFGQ